MNKKKDLLAIPFFIMLSSCVTVYEDAAIVNAPADEACKKVNELIDSHQDGFEKYKGNIVTTRRMDLWDANYHLVGDSCQVWRWSDGKQTYTCSFIVSSEDIAIKTQDKAISFLSSCLGEQWKKESIERSTGNSLRTIFSHDNLKTTASVHRIKTEGVFKPEWTIYYFIGDRDRSL